MDNLTHTLVGILVGETTARVTAPSGSLSATVRRNVFVTVMALGSNVPDLDFIRSRVIDSKLDYLLHHRGHTHTILGALAIAAVLYLASVAWCRWRRHAMHRIDHLQIAGIAALATLLHIGLDATNSYGVHPFWPFDNRWYYGDAVFIVEPLFWASCAPLAFILRSTFAKGFVAFVVVLGIVLSFAMGMVPLLMSVLLTAFAIGMLMLGKFAPPRAALLTALGLWFSINAVFAQSSRIAQRQATAIAHQEFPSDRLLDVVLTPMPVNPACWQVLLMQTTSEFAYVRRATLSIAPNFIAAADCPSRGDWTLTTADYADIGAVSSRTISWRGEVATPLDTLRATVDRDCHAAAFMKFARAPWLVQQAGAWILGDARFDQERALNFAEIELGTNEPCMRYVPPWIEPRRDLLQPSLSNTHE